MINNLLKMTYLSCLGLLVVLLNGCEQRDDLAPVEELRWKEINHNIKQHRVVRGETLYAIAFRYDQDYRQLAAMNHLSSSYTLRVGQILYLKDKRETPRTLPKHPPVYKSSYPTWQKERIIPRPVESRSYHHNNGWMWPVRGRVMASYVPQQGRKGIDIAGKKGEKIYASASGIVAYAGNGLAGYGNLIIIKHDNQYLTAYGNNLHNLVKEGQRIQQGQVIADVGVVDRRFWGVHFEIRKAGKPVNPLHYLKRQ